MLTNKNFLINFHILKENFEFTISDIYCKLVFDSLESKINDKMFIDGCNNILKNTTKEEWNKAYGYKGRPAIADWLNTFMPAMEKKRISKTEPSTGATLTEIAYDYPDWYLEIIKNKELTTNKQNYEKLNAK
jgi:hypothetical protein